MSCHVSEISDAIRYSTQSAATIERLNNFLNGVVDGLHVIARDGHCIWSKGIDDYSTGMNIVSNWYSGRESIEQKATDVENINAKAAIDILGHIRYVSSNLIKDNGMKTIHELAAVGIGYLGGNPYEQS